MSEPNIKWKNSKVKRVHSTSEANKLMESDGPTMVIIYADWCRHCMDSESEWTKLADKVDGRATIYAIESQEYTDEDKVRGYPTIKIVKDGKSTDYAGQRKSDDMATALLGSLRGGKRSRRSRTSRLRNRRRKTHRSFR